MYSFPTFFIPIIYRLYLNTNVSHFIVEAIKKECVLNNSCSKALAKTFKIWLKPGSLYLLFTHQLKQVAIHIFYLYSHEPL
jgi:hypothetical protein